MYSAAAKVTHPPGSWMIILGIMELRSWRGNFLPRLPLPPQVSMVADPFLFPLMLRLIKDTAEYSRKYLTRRFPNIRHLLLLLSLIFVTWFSLANVVGSQTVALDLWGICPRHHCDILHIIAKVSGTRAKSPEQSINSGPRAVDDETSKAMLRTHGPHSLASTVIGVTIAGKLTYPRELLWSSSQRSPENAVDPNLQVGHCWRLPSLPAQLGLKLAERLLVLNVTVDHVPAEFNPDVPSTPRTFIMWGVVDDPKGRKIPDFGGRGPPSEFFVGPRLQKGHRFLELARFQYDPQLEAHAQTFPTHPYVYEMGMDFGMVVLEILNNWGGSSTCLYRVRVHGQESQSVA